jgi:hypothetical protein
MNVEFTRFEKGENWVSGIVNNGEYTFSSKLFDEGSVHGIDGGRVSKLTIREGTGWNNVIVNYDRGWDVEPEDEYEREIYESVLIFLENAPKIE